MQELAHGPHEHGSTRFDLKDLRSRLPGTPHKQMLRLARLLRIAAAWAPVFGEAEQAPSLMHSFVALFGSCELIAFEVKHVALQTDQGNSIPGCSSCKSPS